MNKDFYEEVLCINVARSVGPWIQPSFQTRFPNNNTWAAPPTAESLSSESLNPPALRLLSSPLPRYHIRQLVSSGYPLCTFTSFRIAYYQLISVCDGFALVQFPLTLLRVIMAYSGNHLPNTMDGFFFVLTNKSMFLSQALPPMPVFLSPTLRSTSLAAPC